MRGSIKQRSPGSWTIRLDAGRDPVTKKRNQKTITVRGTKKAAEKELARLLLEAERGTLGASGRMTVAELIERWLDNHVKPNLALLTYVQCTSVARAYIIPLLGTLPLDKLTTAHILAWQSKLRENGLAPNTVRSYCAVLNRALNRAVAWQLLAVNPMARVASPRHATPNRQAFTPDQARRLLEYTKPYPYWHALFTLAITTGMRMGELRGLRWSDVDLQRLTLTITQTIQSVYKHGVIAKSPKTAGSRRQVALGSDVIQLLKKHKAVQNEQRLLHGTRWKDHDLVFSGRDGQPFNSPIIRKHFHAACAALDLPQIRMHDLRHTAATLMLTAGVHPKVVSERLGHSNITITLQTYSHVSATMQQQAAETLDTLLQNGDQTVIKTRDHHA